MFLRKDKLVLTRLNLNKINRNEKKYYNDVFVGYNIGESLDNKKNAFVSNKGYISYHSFDIFIDLIKHNTFILPILNNKDDIENHNSTIISQKILIPVKKTNLHHSIFGRQTTQILIEDDKEITPRERITPRITDEDFIMAFYMRTFDDKVITLNEFCHNLKEQCNLEIISLILMYVQDYEYGWRLDFKFDFGDEKSNLEKN